MLVKFSAKTFVIPNDMGVAFSCSGLRLLSDNKMWSEKKKDKKNIFMIILQASKNKQNSDNIFWNEHKIKERYCQCAV